MKIKIFELKIDAKLYIKVMNYFFELIKTHHISYTFESVNIIDCKLLKKNELRICDLFLCAKPLLKLHILEKSEEPKQYKINKHSFLVFYSMLIFINDYPKSKKYRGLFSKKSCERAVRFFINSFVSSTKNESIFKYISNDFLIEKIYQYIASMIIFTFRMNPTTRINLEDYAIFYKKLIADKIIEPIHSSFLTDNLSISWFTNDFISRETLDKVNEIFIKSF